MEKERMILAQNQEYSMDCYKTGLNNNVLVVGAAGTGKTRGIVIPNILQATGSYVISDPKGNLYDKYKSYLQNRGYEVKLIDFTEPQRSNHYNPFCYIHNDMDIVKLSRIIINERSEIRKDPYWEESACILLQALISYSLEKCLPDDRNLHTIADMIEACSLEDDSNCQNEMDKLIEDLKNRDEKSFAVRQYKKFRNNANKTNLNVLSTLNSKIGGFDTKEIAELMITDDIDIPSIGQKKTALFIVVSDTDRSMDILANILLTQIMNELCLYADKKCDNNELPVPVRFILDDFATNCRIQEFPRMIASFRSRKISVMVMIQAESQLQALYEEDYRTIIGNCDTYMYLGSNDVNTAQQIAIRANLPVSKILNMELGKVWIFRRGQEPINAKKFDLESLLEEKHLIPRRSASCLI